MRKKLRSSHFTILIILSPVICHAETETLEQAWASAYSVNPSLQSERANLRATDELVSQALSHWLPSVDANAYVGRNYQQAPGNPYYQNYFTSNTRNYGVQGTQPVFRGFRTLAETESAEKQVLAERAKLVNAEQQLFIDTANAFFSLVRDQNILKDERENEKVLQQKLDETQVRYNHGDLTKTDVRQAQARLARAHVSRIQAERELVADRASFERLVGHVPATLSEADIDLKIPHTLDELLGNTQNDPNVAAARFSVEQANAEIKKNKGNLLPEVDLVGNSSRTWGESSNIPGRYDSSQVILQATIPLYRSGADYSRTREAEQVYSQKKSDLEEAQHKATETARNAWQSFDSANTAFAADRDEVEADSAALEGVRVESRVGTRTTLDVLNAQQELLDAKTALARAKHDRNLAMVRIKASTGELNADSLKLPIEKYDPEHHYHDVKWKLIGFSSDDANYQLPKPQ